MYDFSGDEANILTEDQYIPNAPSFHKYSSAIPVQYTFKLKCRGGYIAEAGLSVCENPTCGFCTQCTCKRERCKVRGRKCLWTLYIEKMELALDDARNILDDESMKVTEKFASLSSMIDNLIPEVESSSEVLHRLSTSCNPLTTAVSDAERDDIVEWIREHYLLRKVFSSPSTTSSMQN